ncbi:MAG TPA: ABC transporter permease [Ktedonobacterales bacterium]|nr:ABC transporter permease [Ktedonobacterales bacterium]
MNLSDLPAIITAVVVLAFLVFTGFRLGPQFLVRRLAGLLFVVLGVTFITFILGYFAPGDAVIAQLGQHYTPQNARALRHLYGLDLPWYTQYGNFLYRLLHFDLGPSWVDRTRDVWDILRLYVPASMTLGLSSIVVALVIGVPLGMLAAVRANTRYDTVIQTIGLVMFAVPIFVIIPFYQLAMVQLSNNGLPHLQPSGWGTWDTMIAPIAITGVTSFAFYLRFTRTSLIEVLRQDYVRTARAKGLNERIVLWRHAFRNAVLPLITILGPAIGFVVTGLFITENLFNIPGVGQEGINAIVARDFPVVQGIGILLAVAVALMNLVADVVYGIVDPRIKVS